jgi:hypothetical protein
MAAAIDSGDSLNPMPKTARETSVPGFKDRKVVWVVTSSR